MIEAAEYVNVDAWMFSKAAYTGSCEENMSNKDSAFGGSGSGVSCLFKRVQEMVLGAGSLGFGFLPLWVLLKLMVRKMKRITCMQLKSY